MTTLRILADDLTGALDCAAAFGAGVPVHLGQPAPGPASAIDIVATATRDVPMEALPDLLEPSLAWLRDADIAFKKVDSLLRGNTFDEADLLARQGGFQGIVFAPAFPAQGRVTEDGRQWVVRPDAARSPVADVSITEALRGRGWRVLSGPQDSGAAQPGWAWIPDVRSDEEMAAVAALAGRPEAARWLWCGSAGLAHALAGKLRSAGVDAPADEAGTGAAMLVSASYHPVSRQQWRVLRQSRWADQCFDASDPAALVCEAQRYPRLLDLSPQEKITAAEAAALLSRQAVLMAKQAPRPGVLVVVGGDTLLALCRALGAQGLRSERALRRPGWGSARLVGGRWDGVVCHTRSGAFGGPGDLVEVLDDVERASVQAGPPGHRAHAGDDLSP
ncbi:four-carbon acid sugar kinase family protein [Azohydromonas caseinilytica]|uniref:Four-carbon acid sugar kinase family protein n=1 Tax=Azohydromonas caseinilytica TaxID=2728836 RepID=A0A848F8K8_9BURK|nr:four-carbon acid sugar kinase family protein [Azohydromonas caseinilytica]NML15692.1 four-carbon acid sugar kinase family protein [Azohydromonas caseinilytica]